MIINHIIHKAMQTYPTNLTENQWKVIENILNDNRVQFSPGTAVQFSPGTYS